MAQEIASWQDGVDYEFKVTQTAPNVFDVNEAEAAEMSEEEMSNEMSPEDGDYAINHGEKMSNGPKHPNPAIAIVIGKTGKKS